MPLQRGVSPSKNDEHYMEKRKEGVFVKKRGCVCRWRVSQIVEDPLFIMLHNIYSNVLIVAVHGKLMHFLQTLVIATCSLS